MCTQHKQTTPRKRDDPPTHQFPEPSLYPVANHRRANRTANYKAYLRLGVLGYGPAARAGDRTGSCHQPVGPSASCASTPPGASSAIAAAARPLHSRKSGVSLGLPPGAVLGSYQGQHVPASACAARGIRQRALALAAACGKDGAACTGTHPLAETVDLGPATVVRLERALAHWDSRSFAKTVLKIRARACRAPRAKDMAQPVNGTEDLRAGQTSPLRRVKDGDFHNVPPAGDLGCGKSRSEGRLRGLAAATGWGNRPQPRTHLVDEPVDNELRLAIETLSRPGQDYEARGAIGE